MTSDFFTALLDSNVPVEYQEILAKYRQLAREHGVDDKTPLCWRVKAGFSVKDHVPEPRDPHDRLNKYPFDPAIHSDSKQEPTVNSIVFWVPRLLHGTSDGERGYSCKYPFEQSDVLKATRERLGLPQHHLSNFGSASLILGMLLAHLRETGEHVPERFGHMAWTDGIASWGKYLDDFRLCAGWDYDKEDLYCNWAEVQCLSMVGAFALGMEPDI